MRREDAVLLVCGEATVERQQFGPGGDTTAQGVERIANLTLTGEEDEDVTRWLAKEFIDRVADGIDLVGVGVFAGPVANLDRIGAPADLDDRCIAEVFCEPRGLQGCRGDDDA